MSQPEELNLNALVKDLKSTLKEAEQFLYKLKLAPRSTRQKLNSLIICNAIVRKANATVQLLESQCFEGVAPLARTILLHFVDFKNNLLYEDYGDLLDYISAQHWLKSFRAFQQTPDSPYSQSLMETNDSDSLDIAGMIRKQQSALGDIKANINPRYLSGNKVVTTEYRKFELANLLDVYHAFYRLLSKGAHGNLDVIAAPLITERNLHWPPFETEPSIVESHLVLDVVLETTVTLAKKYRKPVPKCKELRKAYHRGLVARGA